MKEIINFTKPYVTKSMYVEITFDDEREIYELHGIDRFGKKINESSKNYSKVAEIFFYELCWMINENIMSKTTIQRRMPKSASKKML